MCIFLNSMYHWNPPTLPVTALPRINLMTKTLTHQRLQHQSPFKIVKSGQNWLPHCQDKTARFHNLPQSSVMLIINYTVIMHTSEQIITFYVFCQINPSQNRISISLPPYCTYTRSIKFRSTLVPETPFDESILLYKQPVSDPESRPPNKINIAAIWLRVVVTILQTVFDGLTTYSLSANFFWCTSAKNYENQSMAESYKRRDMGHFWVTVYKSHQQLQLQTEPNIM